MQSVPGLPQTDFIRIDRCEGATDVVVVFSHTGYPKGKFAMSKALADVPATKVYVNCHANSWYQKGVPGVTTSVDETAALLRRILDDLNPSRVICIGMSMGGYAALLFGLKLRATAVIAFTSEVLLGEEYARSYTMNGLKQYDYRYASLAPLLRQNTATRTHIIYGAYDLIDLSLLWAVGDTLTNPKHTVHFASGGHSVTYRLNVASILRAALSKGDVTPEDIHPRYLLPVTLTEDDCLRYRESQRLIARKDHSGAYDLLKPVAHRSAHDSFFFGRTCLDLKRYSEAKEAFLRSVSLDPYSAETYHLLGLSLHLLGDYDEAAQAYRTALSFNEALSGTHFRLGMTCLQLHDETAAEASLRRAVELRPGFEEAQTHLNALLKDKGSQPCRLPAREQTPQHALQRLYALLNPFRLRP